MKINQNPDSKKIFHIEIALSENQLKVLCEQDGDEEYESLKYYDMMTSDKYQVITKDPSFDSGFGADINDILSLGFLMMNFLEKENLTVLKYEDLNWHPFRIKIPKVEDVKFEIIDCEMDESGYEPMVLARDSESGEVVNVNDLFHRCKKCNATLHSDIGDGLCVQCWLDK